MTQIVHVLLEPGDGYAEEMFMRMDANKDGKLTPEERKAYWQARKSEHEQKKDLKKKPKKS